MKSLQIAVLAACLYMCTASYLPEKLVKKYAHKIIFEDCFGKEVTSDMEKEMFAAHVKCSGHHPEALPAADALFSGDDGDDGSFSRRRRNVRHFSPHKLEKMRAKITAFVGNATCMFKELKMLDQANNVDLGSIKERVANLPVEEALRNDLDKSAEACHQFSSCLPDSVVSQPGEMMGFSRQMLFFKCFKEAKLESCMKKTFREDYLPMLVEDSMPADEDESFYTIISAAIVGEKKGY